MRSALVVAAMLAGPAAHAEDRGEVSTMAEYFTGERTGGLVLVGMGVAGTSTGALLVTTASGVGEGLAYPLLGMGAVHLAAGAFVVLASRGRERAFAAEIGRDPQAWSARERARMAGVSKQLTGLKIVEVVLIAGGLTVAGIGHGSERPVLEGFGYGLAIEAAATLVFDVVAGRRALRYRAALAPPLVSNPPMTPVLSHAIAF